MIVECMPVAIHWTFVGCGAEPAESQDCTPTVRFTSAGVCVVSVEITDTRHDPPIQGCGNVWHGQKTFYVLGGPLTVEVTRGGECRHVWDDESGDRPPWYLTYFDYNPAMPVPGGAQTVNKATVTADRADEQPPGTQYVWTVLAPGVILTPGVVSGQPSGVSQILVAANGASAQGAIKVYLTYRLQVPGFEWPFEWGDDTDVVPRANNHDEASPDYRSFTGHRPTAIALARDAWVLQNVVGPPEWIYEEGWAFYIVDNHDLPMDGISAQERFPNGVPTQFPDGTPAEFHWNGNLPRPRDMSWTTGNDVIPGLPPRGHPEYKPCFKDILGVRSPAAYDHPGEAAFGPFVRPLSVPPKELIHTYHGGTVNVFPSLGGCQVGTCRITIWTNKTENALVSIP